MPFRFAPKRLRRDTRGATAVEFGLIAFPFLAALCAIFEAGYVHFQSEVVSGAVEMAARAMLTGRVQAAGTSTAQQFVTNYLCPAATKISPTLNCANFIVDVRPATSFTGADMTNDFYTSANNQFCPGAPGQIVILRVAYPLPAILPLNLFSRSAGTVSNVPGLAGTYHILMGEAAFTAENYSGSYTPPAGC